MKQIVTGILLAAAAATVTNPRSASPTPANSPTFLVLEGPAGLCVVPLPEGFMGRSLLTGVQRAEAKQKEDHQPVVPHKPVGVRAPSRDERLAKERCAQ